MRNYFEANFDEILNGIGGNEYLKTSWEHVNRTLSESLSQFFQGNSNGKTTRNLKNLKEFLSIECHREKFLTGLAFSEEKLSRESFEDGMGDYEGKRVGQEEDYMNLLQQSGKQFRAFNEILEKETKVKNFRYVSFWGKREFFSLKKSFDSIR